MPLIDENTRATDRRPGARWAWGLVIAGLAGLWVAIAGLVSLLPRFNAGNAPPPAAVVRQFNQQQLQQAEQMGSYGQWGAAAAAIKAVDPSQPMSDSDKHQYFRTGARALLKTGDLAGAAGFYERFLSLGTRVHQPDCRGCHNTRNQIPPLKLADLKTSALGKAYATILKKARKLEAKRKELQATLQKQDDPRARLLLYHIETLRGDTRAAQAHARAIRDWDTRQILKAK